MAETEIDEKGHGEQYRIPRILGHYHKIYGSAENIEFFYCDHINSRRVVISSVDTQLDGFVYTTWGMMTHPLGLGSDNYLAFYAGKSYDATGLVYFNARYYDPTLGRFLSEDLKKDEVAWFAYARNNPINRIDMDGKNSIFLGPFSNPEIPPFFPSTQEVLNMMADSAERRSFVESHGIVGNAIGLVTGKTNGIDIEGAIKETVRSNFDFSRVTKTDVATLGLASIARQWSTVPSAIAQGVKSVASAVGSIVSAIGSLFK